MSRFKKINNFIHLWLGLISGLIMFVVCLMAAIWVFQEEIINIFYPPMRISQQEKPVIPPSVALHIADSLYPGKKIRSVVYTAERPVVVGVNKWNENPIDLQVDPYSGKSLGNGPDKTKIINFFRFVLNGHRFLWLPWETGRVIVNYATLTFIFILISGLIWWYPKKWNSSTRNKSFKIKWNANWKRVNIDFHNVLGFYAMLVLFVLASTGIVYGIEWYSKSYYWLTTGKSEAEWPVQESDSTLSNRGLPVQVAMDKAFEIVVQRHPKAYILNMNYPDTADRKSPVNVYASLKKGVYYAGVNYAFDRYTAKELPGHELYGKPIEQNALGEKIQRMNYDIHVGSILGLPGKILAFCAALIGASLPVTGFIIWYNRKFGKKKKGKNLGRKNLKRPIEKDLSAS